MHFNNTFTLILFSCFFSTIVLGQDQNLQLANEQLQDLATELNYSEQEISHPIITDHYTSRGITHIYYQQTVNQIGVYGTNAAVHIKNNEVVSANLQFIRGLEKRNIKQQFQVQALEAVARLALQKGYPLSQTELVILEANAADPQQPTTVSAAGISNRTIPLKLVFIEDAARDLQLAWSVFIDEKNGANYKNFLVNATTGAIEKEINLTINCTFDHEHDNDHRPTDFLNKNNIEHLLLAHKNQGNVEKIQLANSYKVYAVPVESPNHGIRSNQTSPWSKNTTASPNGWHKIGTTSYTTTRGNNVDAYNDSNGTSSPTNGDADRANGGATLSFDFPINISSPSTSKPAAITNLFYWNNIIHDIWYNYGFDEPSGNFQEENFGRGGTASDYVQAEAQDGGGTCNANFSTPADGGNPRMQMYICGTRDGDLDNAVIVHEYGHGISTRLTGGPSSSSCLNNQEQMGEGWSDWFGMVMTIEAGDMATDARPMGTWLFEQGPTGAGIRPYPYSTNLSVNPMTYNSIKTVSVPHGVGSVWATMLWDLTWAMIDRYGWDADLYNGTGGNNKTMNLVIEGLKLQPCSPGFVDGRDAILAADRLLNGGANACLIWEVFANRGLGYSADQGSTNSRSDGTEAFDLPPSCTVSLEKIADKTSAAIGEEITYTILATNHQTITLNGLVIKDFLPSNVEFVSATNGGTPNGQTISWPAISLTPNEDYSVNVVGKIKSGIEQVTPIFTDSLETGTGNWVVTTDNGNGTWNYQTTKANSATHAYHSPGTAPDSYTNLTLATPLNLTDESELIFNHQYEIEAEWDGGVVQISIDNGQNWIDLKDHITQNRYNPLITKNNFYGFHGSSGGWIATKVNLSAFAGYQAIIRFQMRYDYSVFEAGWYIDDISVSNLGLSVLNTAEISNATITTTATVAQATEIIFTPQSECEDVLTAEFNQPDIPSNDYRVSGDITSNGTVKTRSNVHFYAGNSITLLPGFVAEFDSEFLAKIEACDTGGETSFTDSTATTSKIKVANTTISTKNNKVLTTNNALSVRPNPFSQQATIDYEIGKNSPIFIGLHDLTGKMIKVLLNQPIKEAGTYQLTLSSEALQNGVYWITMRTNGTVITKKVFLVKS